MLPMEVNEELKVKSHTLHKYIVVVWALICNGRRSLDGVCLKEGTQLLPLPWNRYCIPALLEKDMVNKKNFVPLVLRCVHYITS